MNEKLMEYFNKQPRLGTLSTAGKDVKRDVRAERALLLLTGRLNPNVPSNQIIPHQIKPFE